MKSNSVLKLTRTWQQSITERFAPPWTPQFDKPRCNYELGICWAKNLKVKAVLYGVDNLAISTLVKINAGQPFLTDSSQTRRSSTVSLPPTTAANERPLSRLSPGSTTGAAITDNHTRRTQQTRITQQTSNPKRTEKGKSQSQDPYLGEATPLENQKKIRRLQRSPMKNHRCNARDKETPPVLNKNPRETSFKRRCRWETPKKSTSKPTDNLAGSNCQKTSGTLVVKEDDAESLGRTYVFEPSQKNQTKNPISTTWALQYPMRKSKPQSGHPRISRLAARAPEP